MYLAPLVSGAFITFSITPGEFSIKGVHRLTSEVVVGLPTKNREVHKECPLIRGFVFHQFQ